MLLLLDKSSGCCLFFSAPTTCIILHQSEIPLLTRVVQKILVAGFRESIGGMGPTSHSAQQSCCWTSSDWSRTRKCFYLPFAGPLVLYQESERRVVQFWQSLRSPRAPIKVLPLSISRHSQGLRLEHFSSEGKFPQGMSHRIIRCFQWLWTVAFTRRCGEDN